MTWALVRSGLLSPEALRKDETVGRLIAQIEVSDDPYIVALGGLTAFYASRALYTDKEEDNPYYKSGMTSAKRLLLFRDDADGAVRRNAKETITRSSGDALELETTALASLVWLRGGWGGVVWGAC